MSNVSQGARAIAFRVLLEVFDSGAYANLALDKALFACNLDQRDRNLVTELVYGTVKYKLRLEYILDHVAKPKTAKMDRKTYTLLLMSVYQLEFLTRIPAHAVVNEAVQLAKALHLRSEKFINAVLRRTIDALPELNWPDPHKQRLTYLSKRQSLPQWMLEIWHKRFGYQRTVALCTYFNAPAPLWVRTNTLQTTPDELAHTLRSEGIDVQRSNRVPEGLLLSGVGDLRRMAAFQKGDFIVQDESSMLVAHALQPQPDETILDMCAAPGGKTTHIAMLMKNTGKVVACDLHAHRLALVKENIKRLGLTNIELMETDATQLPAEWQDRFDRILLDAPCSGLGVLNRRADSRWHKHKQDIPALVALQAELLATAARVVKPGGRIIYSTCTLTHEENRMQIDHFLATHPNFYLDTNLGQSWCHQPSTDGTEEMVPDVDRMDGFFIAALMRKDAP